LQPATIASAAAIAPSTFLTIITGTVQIADITPPVTGTHMLVFIFTNSSPGVLLTSGNILNAIEPTQDIPVIVVYNPITGKYSGGELKLT
jgi:hypothetical protein